MRPLTDQIPKPLLQVNGKALIEYHIEALVSSGVCNIVINHGWLGEQIPEYLGNGVRYGASIRYSPEPPEALETGGGIVNALSLLGSEPFLVVNGDLFTDYPFSRLMNERFSMAHLVLVENPRHHPDGDFVLKGGEVINYGGRSGEPHLTYSGIARFDPRFFAGNTAGRFPLAPLLFDAIDRGEVTGEYFGGMWSDVGTPERLHLLHNLDS